MNRINAVAVTVLISSLASSAAGTIASAQQSHDMNSMSMTMSADAAKPADGGAAKLGNLDISGGYVRMMLPGQPVGGGYISIRNGGGSDDKLVSVTSPEAGTVELHEMTMQDNIMKMREVKGGIAVAAGATVTLSPNGLHMMFKQVKAPFKLGGTVPVTLTFEKAGAVDVVLPVKSIQGN